MLTAEDIIARLGLAPLTIEGGYFRENYRAPLRYRAEALPATYGSERSASTAIYYLHTAQTFSAMHRLKSDEVYHFYAGDAVEMLQLTPDGRGAVVKLGNTLEAGLLPQLVVPAGVWQGSRLVPGGKWALMGTTVAPGFEYGDFDAAERGELIVRYPNHEKLIVALTSE